MYRKFYGLEESPFNLTPDSRFLFLSQRHKEALAALVYGITEQKGFICLTGEIGSGKTTLCRALVSELPPNTKIALVFNPSVTELELLRTINDEFGLRSDYETKKGLIDELNKFLLEKRTQGINVVLIIDEAQNLDPTVLEQIRMLSNLETETDKLLQIVLMGQPELLTTLALPNLEQLAQRITVRYHISPLNEEETIHYIKHRIFIAKAKIDIEFTPKAYKLIYHYTKGLPRKLNVLCDRALLIGYVDGTYTIDDRIVKKAIDEIDGKMRLSPKTQDEDNKMFGTPFALKMLLGFSVIVLIIVFAALTLFIYSSREVFFSSAKIMQPIQPDLFVKKPPPPPPPAPKIIPQVANPAQNAKGALASAQNLLGKDASTTATKENIAAKTPPPPQYYWDVKNGVAIVSNTDLAFQASLVNLLTVWNVKVDLDALKKEKPEQIKNTNMLQYAKNVGIKRFDISGTMDDVIAANIPVILSMRTDDKKFPPYIVLTRIAGEAYTIADPEKGLRIVKRKDIINSWQGNAVAFFIDDHNFTTLASGEQSDRVKFLQDFLQKNKYYNSKIDGVYEARTIQGIKNLQKAFKIEPTGAIDLKTAAIISTKSTKGAPKIIDSIGGE